MDEQAQVNGGGWHLLAIRIRTLAPELPERVGPLARQARRLFPNAQFWTWPYALLPIAVALSMLIVAAHTISWWLVGVEALAAIFALAGWGATRAYRPGSSGIAPLILGGGLLVVAAIGAVILARNAPLIIPLGVVALLLMAPSVLSTFTSVRIPAIVTLLARIVVAPALLGLGLFAVTAQAQGARMTSSLWLLGSVMSLLAGAAALSRVMAGAGVQDGAKLWLRLWLLLALALFLAGAGIVWSAVPSGAPHGILLALLALPTALIAVSALARSTFQPARVWAAERIGAIYTYVGLALTTGALASLAIAAAVDALTKSLGF